MRVEQSRLGLCFFSFIFAFHCRIFMDTLWTFAHFFFTILVSPLMSVAYRNTSV